MGFGTLDALGPGEPKRLIFFKLWIVLRINVIYPKYVTFSLTFSIKEHLCCLCGMGVILWWRKGDM